MFSGLLGDGLSDESGGAVTPPPPPAGQPPKTGDGHDLYGWYDFDKSRVTTRSSLMNPIPYGTPTSDQWLETLPNVSLDLSANVTTICFWAIYTSYITYAPEEKVWVPIVRKGALPDPLTLNWTIDKIGGYNDPVKFRFGVGVDGGFETVELERTRANELDQTQEDARFLLVATYDNSAAPAPPTISIRAYLPGDDPSAPGGVQATLPSANVNNILSGIKCLGQGPIPEGSTAFSHCRGVAIDQLFITHRLLTDAEIAELISPGQYGVGRAYWDMPASMNDASMAHWWPMDEADSARADAHAGLTLELGNLTSAHVLPGADGIVEHNVELDRSHVYRVKSVDGFAVDMRLGGLRHENLPPHIPYYNRYYVHSAVNSAGVWVLSGPNGLPAMRADRGKQARMNYATNGIWMGTAHRTVIVAGTVVTTSVASDEFGKRNSLISFPNVGDPAKALSMDVDSSTVLNLQPDNEFVGFGVNDEVAVLSIVSQADSLRGRKNKADSPSGPITPTGGYYDTGNGFSMLHGQDGNDAQMLSEILVYNTPGSGWDPVYLEFAEDYLMTKYGVPIPP